MEYTLCKYRLLPKFRIYTLSKNNEENLNGCLRPFYQVIAQIKIERPENGSNNSKNSSLGRVKSESSTILCNSVSEKYMRKKTTNINSIYSLRIIFFDDSVIWYHNFEQNSPYYNSSIKANKFSFCLNHIRQLCVEKFNNTNDKFDNEYEILYLTKYFTYDLFLRESTLDQLPTALYCTENEYKNIFIKKYCKWHHISLSASVQCFYLMQSSNDFNNLEFLDSKERKKLCEFFNGCFETFNRLYTRLYLEAKIENQLHKNFELLYILMS